MDTAELYKLADALRRLDDRTSGHLRIGQALVAVCGTRDLFYVTDDMLVATVDEFRNTDETTTGRQKVDGEMITPAEILAGAERASARVAKWSQWKRDLSKPRKPYIKDET